MKSIFTEDEVKTIVLQRALGMREPLNNAYERVLDSMSGKPNMSLAPRSLEITVLAAYYFDRLLDALASGSAEFSRFVAEDMKSPLILSYFLAIEDESTTGVVPNFNLDLDNDYVQDVQRIEDLVSAITKSCRPRDGSDREDELRLISACMTTRLTTEPVPMLDLADALLSAMRNVYMLGRIDERK